MRTTRLVATTAIFVLLGLSLAACGGDDKSGDKSGPVTIDIVQKDGKITPSDGHVVNVGVGDKITLNITSDADDEIHVHSVPEHEFEVKPGTTTETFTIDEPISAVVESHDLDVVIVTLHVQ